jgi:YggT family protein
MVATSANILFYLVKAVLTLAMGACALRVLLQLVHANFYNPISQVVWKLTQPLVRPLLSLLPKAGSFDVAGGVVLFLFALLYAGLISAMLGFGLGWLQLGWIAALSIVSLVLNLYFLCLFALAIVSWVGPGTGNPAANVLWSLCEPLLRPVRRVLPPVSGLDLSPIPVMLALGLIERLLPHPLR